jgi:pimeloyl-ACP methyl ester carboxylesterase
MTAAVVALLGLVAAGVLYQRIAGRRRQFAPPGSLIDVGNHRLHVRCAGAGTPFVLLEAGVAASSLGWSRVQPDVARFTRVCAYDRAGLAWSDPASSPRTFTLIVDELARVIANVAPRERCILVGHSFGSHSVGGSTSTRPTTRSGWRVA